MTFAGHSSLQFHII